MKTVSLASSQPHGRLVAALTLTLGVSGPLGFSYKEGDCRSTHKGSFILERKRTRKGFFTLMFAVTAVAVV